MSMLQVPGSYENEAGIVKKAGSYIKEFADNVLVVGGNTALQVVEKELTASLEAEGIRYEIIADSGYPVQQKAKELAEKIKSNGFQAIVGTGGGKIMDLVKAAGFYADIPVVTIPTIAATCAAWSGLSVLYTQAGEQDIYLYIKEFPRLVLADKEILRKAPVRYLNAGVADTIVKWYELYPDLRRHPGNFPLRLQLKVCELALEYLKTDYVQAWQKGILFESGQEEIVENAIDSILMLAGLAGSIKGSIPYGGLAHPFYNASTFVKETHSMLHGEKVIFGLLVQLTLEHRNDEEIADFTGWMRELQLPVSLEEIGLHGQDKEKVIEIAERMIRAVGHYDGLDFELTAEDIAGAILTVDARSRKRGA